MRSSAHSTSSRSRTDRLIEQWARVCAMGAGTIVVFIVAAVAIESWSALTQLGPLRFLTDPSWYPSEGTFGLAPMLAGTLAATTLAVAIAAPIGVLSALFCRFYAPIPVAGMYRKLVELLAGIPSVVYGFWGLTTLVPLIAAIRAPGASLLAGGLIIALMIVPTVALLTEGAIMSVPVSYTRAAASLGLTRWGTLRRVVLPSARSGIFTAVLLATARAIGETMAVLMVCGNVVQTPHTVFDPIRTLTANIALEMAYAMDVHRSTLFVAGLVLAAAVIALVAFADRADASLSDG